MKNYNNFSKNLIYEESRSEENENYYYDFNKNYLEQI